MKKIVLYSSKPGVIPIVVELDIDKDHFLDINRHNTPAYLCVIGIKNEIEIPQLEWLMKRNNPSFDVYRCAVCMDKTVKDIITKHNQSRSIQANI